MKLLGRFLPKAVRFTAAGGLLLFSLSCLAQQDIVIINSGAYKQLALNKTWTGAGPSSLNNNYIISTFAPNEGICVYVTNNDTVNSHGYGIQAFSTGDINVGAFTGNTSKWTLIGPSNTTVTSNLASTTRAYFIQAQGAARIVVSFSGGSGTSTGSIFTVESPIATGCGNQTTAPVVCPMLYSGTVPAASTSLILPAASNQAVYICSLSIAFQAAPGGGASVDVIEGTGALCVTNPVTVFSLPTDATAPLYSFFAGQPLIPRFFANGADFVGNGLCVSNGDATAVTVNMAIAQF